MQNCFPVLFVIGYYNKWDFILTLKLPRIIRNDLPNYLKVTRTPSNFLKDKPYKSLNYYLMIFIFAKYNRSFKRSNSIIQIPRKYV